MSEYSVYSIQQIGRNGEITFEWFLWSVIRLTTLRTWTEYQHSDTFKDMTSHYLKEWSVSTHHHSSEGHKIQVRIHSHSLNEFVSISIHLVTNSGWGLEEGLKQSNEVDSSDSQWNLSFILFHILWYLDPIQSQWIHLSFSSTDE